MDKTNLGLVRDSFSNVVYTHTIHEIEAKENMKNASIISWFSVSITILILISLLLQIAYPDLAWLGIALTVAELAVLMIQLTFRFGKKSMDHKKTALSLLGVRNKHMSLMADIINNSCTQKEIVKTRDALFSELKDIYSYAPTTKEVTYSKAQKKLNPIGAVDGESFTTIDEEIDRFLPEELKSTTYNKEKDGN